MTASAVFPEFQDPQEFAGFMSNVISLYEKYSGQTQTPDFLKKLVGPRIHSLPSFAIEKRGMDSRIVPRVSYQQAFGIGESLDAIHDRMRKLAIHISDAFAHYYPKNIDDQFDPIHVMELFPGEKPEVLIALVNDKEYSFNHQYEILMKTYALGGVGTGFKSRPKDMQDAIKKTSGAAQAAFANLLFLAEGLEYYFIPKEGRVFEDTGFKFDFKASCQDIAQHTEDMHQSRLYFYLFMDEEFYENRFFWKEPPPEIHQPIPISTPVDAACCLIALGQIAAQYPPEEKTNEFEQLLSVLRIRSQQLSECQTLEQVAAFLSNPEFSDILMKLDSAIATVPEEKKMCRERCEDALAGLMVLRQQGIEAGALYIPPIVSRNIDELDR